MTEKAEKLDPTALTPETLARLLSVSAKRIITAEQVATIAEAGNLLSTDGKVNLLHYTAYLLQKNSQNAE